MAVGNRGLLAIFSEPILVRWLSGRKQRFAKAPYLKRVSRVRIPPSPPAHKVPRAAWFRHPSRARVSKMRHAPLNDPRVHCVTTDKRNGGDARRCRVRRPPCSTETTVNLSKLSQIIFVGVCAGSF